MGLTAFRIVDLTFIGPGQAWALGTADCLRGPGRCPAMVTTTDGRHWHSSPVPSAEVAASCVDKDGCVSNVRFASPLVGYAFGPSTLFMTDDGGAHWERQPGGAAALEALDGNVIRVLAPQVGCPGPCIQGVETAPIGATHWSPSRFQPPKTSVAGLSLARVGSRAYLLVTGNPAGGASGATSHLYVSADDGGAWTDTGEPCPQLSDGGEVDSTAVNTASDGAVVVGCLERQPPNRVSVAVSVDGGDSFHGRPSFATQPITAVAAATDSGLFAVAGVLYASTDSGEQFHPVVRGPHHPTWLGFESATTGHAVEQAQSAGNRGSTLWSTTDGGRTWSSYRFP